LLFNVLSSCEEPRSGIRLVILKHNLAIRLREVLVGIGT
jgi:hypothetical protein